MSEGRAAVEVSDSPSDVRVETARDGSSLGDWRANVCLWAWAAGVEGDVGARGRVAELHADAFEILDESDSVIAIAGRLEVGKGRWGGFVDGMYANLGADDQSGPAGLISIDIDFEIALVDFGLTYRVAEWAPTGGAARNPRDASVDLYAGGRYTYLELEIDPANLAPGVRSKDWLDPIVGAKLVLPLAEHWHVSANGDIGGFGVESDFTWSTTAVIGYDFRLFQNPASILFGYRAIGQDYSDGSGADRFVWDVVLHGPIVGFVLEF